MEDPASFHQYPPMDSFVFQLDDLDFDSFSESLESYSSQKRFNSESTQNSFPVESPEYQSVAPATRPTKQLKTESTNTWTSTTTTYGTHLKAPNKASPNPSSKIISFENCNVASQQFYKMDPNVKPKTETGYGENLDFTAAISQGALNYDKLENKATTTTARNSVQARDHVIAERKRREKLSQRFIALSAILPGLKKMDKASVLEDAIKYVKQLQEQVKNLEEKVTDKTVESAVFVKRSILFSDDDSSSSDENSDQQLLPEIEARVSGKDVLIRIHCDKHSGRASLALLSELEKNNLTVQSSSVLPFGNNALDITIVAQMNKEYNLKTKDLIRRLSQALRQLI
ncbi:Myc-type, basic helix-loop-helix [Sesbania bispinosa]|nr:Myc-type, basic helix-loop-helix [Sesbania bispinosa]